MERPTHFYDCPDGSRWPARLKQSSDRLERTWPHLATASPRASSARPRLSESWRSLLSRLPAPLGPEAGEGAKLSVALALRQRLRNHRRLADAPGPGGFAHGGAGRERQLRIRPAEQLPRNHPPLPMALLIGCAHPWGANAPPRSFPAPGHPAGRKPNGASCGSVRAATAGAARPIDLLGRRIARRRLPLPAFEDHPGEVQPPTAAPSSAWRKPATALGGGILVCVLRSARRQKRNPPPPPRRRWRSARASANTAVLPWAGLSARSACSTHRRGEGGGRCGKWPWWLAG